MKHIFHTIQYTARAATVLLLALLAAQTAGAQEDILEVSNALNLLEAFNDPTVSVINVTNNITGVGGLSLDRALTINLNGHTISGDGLYFDVGPDRSLTINGEGQGGSVGNIISSNAGLNAINDYGTVTLSNVNITTNYDCAIGGSGWLYIGNNVSFNGWTERPFSTRYVKGTEGGNYIYGTVVATVNGGGTRHYFENLGAALVYIAKHPDTTLETPDLSDDFSWSGDTYTIHTDTGWGYFCDMLEAGETFSGKTVELANDITVTRMAGGQPFTGTFDGGGHTLTLAYGTADAPVDAQFVAPFVETASGTSPVFRNLTIDGTIYATHTAATDHDHVGGLIGHLFGTVTIEHCVSRVEIHAKGGAGGFVGLCEHSVSFTDCLSSAVITSPGGNNSGFVAWSRSSGWEINFTGCLFDGKLLQQNGTGASNGGFIGWKGDAKTVNITNCLCAPATLADGETMATDGSATFSREHSNYPATITNCYYTQTLGAAQGKQARAVTAGTDVTVAHAGVSTHYATSGITAYKATGASTDSDPFIAGLLYNNNVVDVLYAGIDEVVSLTLSNTGAPAGYSFNGYTASAGTLDDNNILTMPDEDVTVSLALAVLPWSGDGTEDSPYIIYNKDQLDLLAYRVNGTHGETCQTNGYKDTYFKLNNDISYPHTSDWDDAECEQESNFEPIGGRYDNNNRSFCGHFDGNNNTISGIRIYKDGDGDADNYQGIFGRTNGADIHDLTLADARITGYDDTGGIVGYNYGGTVSGCHVADDVAVCAVQSDAYYHGGIVGYNDGTIEQCTSAATLTTADASNSYCYGGIAGYNGGTLCDNLAIGATMPAAAYNSYGAITGHNNYGTLEHNYYTACKVADTENATGVGCGYISDGNGGRITADVTANNGAVSIHTLTLAEGITTTTAATVTIGTTGYYAQGTAIALSYSGTIGDGYQLGIVRNDGNGFTAAVADGDGHYTAVMPAANATATDHAPIDWATVSTGADKDNAYMIYNKDQLDLLAHRVNGTHGETRREDGYENKFFQLAKDISYPHTSDWNDFDSDESNYEAIGGYYDDGYRPFRGHFDGNNNTISGIRIYKNGNASTDRYQGIFGLTDGADIHHLTLADARITGYDDTGGIVGDNYGGTVSRCHVADDVAVCAVQYNAYYHGGIVGSNLGTIEQCNSAATLTTADADNSGCYGGIAGYNNGGTLRDNLAIGATVPAAEANTYGAITGYNDGGTLLRNYYAACKVADTENATNVGCNNADVTADNGAVSIHTLTLADGITTTTAATVTIGTTGYYAQGTAIALSYSGTIGDGYQLGIVRNDGNGFTAAVADGDGHYTAVMPAANATATDHAPIDWATVSTGADKDNAYMIYNKDQLDLLAHRVNGTHGETRQEDGYENKFFQLANDISYPHTSDWNDFDSDESNYEAIGGYYYDDDRSFRGHFDGNNKTISGIRIYKDGDGDADCFQGIFGLTVSGADIHDLTLADARITGYQYTGGIVGYNDGGTVSGCHVAADVAVCAVQSYAWYHGGIVGLNRGTIEQCTSAATLTIANADNSQYYGGIAGYNNKGTLSDNLAIGAIVPAAKNNSYGAITGYTGGAGGTLQRNYYTACKVNDTENATGVGCGNIDDGNGGYITADVTANNGAVCINTLALTANLAPDGNYWTTYYNSALGFTIDENENACAYTATYGGSQLTLHKLGKEIPKNTAVIIVADNDVVSMTAATALDDFSGTNDLLGVDDDTPISILDEFGTFYVLGMTTVGGDQHFGFHRYTGTDMAAHKAFIFVASSPSQAPARSLTMVFDDATGIQGLTPAAAPQSPAADHWFTLDGRRLQAKPTAPGIYVNNGKKVVIK